MNKGLRACHNEQCLTAYRLTCDVQALSVANREGARFLTLGLLLLVLLSSIGFPGNGASLLPSPIPTLQRNSLAFTVQPDRNVKVGWNTTTTLPPSALPKNLTSLFPPGYAIHSTSSFSQQANAVVQTSTTQYQVPQVVVIQSPLSNVNSITFTATQTGLSGQGTLTVNTNPAVILPANNIMVTYSYDLAHVHVSALAQLYFFPSFSGTSLNLLSSQAAFQANWTATFGNPTWTSMMISQIQTATRILKVTTFSGTITAIDSVSASVSVTFDAVPTSKATDFVTAFEQALASMGAVVPAGLDSVIRSALALSTSESFSLTYTGSTKTVVLQSTANYVADLDSQVNSLKNRFFQLVFQVLPAGIPIPAPVLFINSTSVAVSQISTTSDLDLNASISKTTFQGLVIKPPIVGSNTNFTIPGLFQTVGAVPQPAVNVTLVGGSNATYSVKVIVPSGMPAPSTTTTNSATWTNVHNATVLSAVRFELVATPSSFLAVLLSPPALALEGVAAVGVAAGVLLLLRRRRIGAPTPGPVMGPAPTPEPGPAPPVP